MFTPDYLLVCLVCFVIMLLTIRYALTRGNKDEGEGGIPEEKIDAPDAPVAPESRRKELV